MLTVLLIGGLAVGAYFVYNHVTLAKVKADMAIIKAKLGKL